MERVEAVGSEERFTPLDPFRGLAPRSSSPRTSRCPIGAGRRCRASQNETLHPTPGSPSSPGHVMGCALGPNGAGKTTSIRILTTILRPTQPQHNRSKKNPSAARVLGRLRRGERHPAQTRPAQIRPRIGVLPGDARPAQPDHGHRIHHLLREALRQARRRRPCPPRVGDARDGRASGAREIADPGVQPRHAPNDSGILRRRAPRGGAGGGGRGGVGGGRAGAGGVSSMIQWSSSWTSRPWAWILVGNRSCSRSCEISPMSGEHRHHPLQPTRCPRSRGCATTS